MAPSTPQDEVQSDQSLIGAMQPRKKARSWKGVVTSPLRLGPSCWPGITNLGNTCYASALAQALSACPPFMKQASLVAPDKLKSSPPTWLALYDVARNAQISFEQRMEELVEAHKNPESFKPEDDESEEVCGMERNC